MRKKERSPISPDGNPLRHGYGGRSRRNRILRDRREDIVESQKPHWEVKSGSRGPDVGEVDDWLNLFQSS